MNHLFRHLAEQTLSRVRNQPMVVLAVGDVNLREALRGYLCADYDVKIARDTESAFAASSSRVACILFDRTAGFASGALHDNGQTTTIAPLVRVLAPDEDTEDDAVGQKDIPVEPECYLRQPILRRQLLATVKSMAALIALSQDADAQQAEQNRILDGFHESFIAVDANWQITHMNAAAERTIGVVRRFALGKNAWEVLPDSAIGTRGPVYKHAMEERLPIKLDSVNVDSGWFDIDVVPLENGGLAIYFRNATQIRQAEAAVTAGEQRMRLYLEHTSDYAFVILNPDGKILEWLGGAEAITGWGAAEVVGRSLEVLLTEDEKASSLFQKEFTTAAQTGRAENRRWLLKKDGSRFFVNGVTAAIRDENGTLQGYGKIFRDSSEEKLAEEALRESREQLQLILDSTADGIVGIADDGCCTFLNPAAGDMLGYLPEELSGVPVAQLIHRRSTGDGPYGNEESEGDVMLAVHNGVKLCVIDDVFVRKDGTVFPVHCSVNPMVKVDGDVAGAVLAFSDVTESKQAETALRESERKLRFVMDSMPQKIFSATSTGDVNYLNPAWKFHTGLPFEQLLGWGWTQFVHQDDSEQAVSAWRHSIAVAEPFHCECRYYDAGGSYRWHLFQARPLRDASGSVAMWVGSATDINYVKAAEARLAEELVAEKRSAALLADLASTSRALNSDLSVDGVINILTRKARTILGIDQADVLLSDDPGQDGASANFLPESVDFSAGYDLDHVGFDADEPYPGRVAGSLDGGLLTPLIGPAGQHLGLLRVSRKAGGDFSDEDQAILAQLATIAAVSIENARLYESLREQDQRKDEFLATLAHELRNPLAPLRTGLDLLKLSGTGEQTARIRGMMERQLAHMVRLVDDLMDVSRVSRGKIELKRERVPIRVLFDTALEAARPLIEASEHQLSVSLPEEPVEVYGDPTRLAQVVSNLLNNAAKYTSQRGKIELVAGREGNQVVIRVSDTGSGIPREMLSKVFGLFTQVSPSTDRSRGGVGIGLALVKKLVELHGGSVSAESPGFGQGSTFCVRLPLLQQNASKIDSTATQVGEPKRKQKRILVVDDNIEAAETLGMLLEYSGHKVASAHTGDDALKVARKFVPDIVFLDIGLPGMSGYDVARILRREFPDSEMVLVALTGWGGDEGRRRAREAGFDHHLTKPIDGKGLTDVLDRFSNSKDASVFGESPS